MGKADLGRQKAEGRRQKAEEGDGTSGHADPSLMVGDSRATLTVTHFCLLTSAF
jgi:hypothetical protein